MKIEKKIDGYLNEGLFGGGLQKLAKKAVLQGQHKNRIIDYYTTLALEFHDQFTEDNLATMKSFLKECFNASMQNLEKKYKKGTDKYNKTMKNKKKK